MHVCTSSLLLRFQHSCIATIAEEHVTASLSLLPYNSCDGIAVSSPLSPLVPESPALINRVHMFRSAIGAGKAH